MSGIVHHLDVNQRVNKGEQETEENDPSGFVDIQEGTSDTSVHELVIKITVGIGNIGWQLILIGDTVTHDRVGTVSLALRLAVATALIRSRGIVPRCCSTLGSVEAFNIIRCSLGAFLNAYNVVTVFGGVNRGTIKVVDVTIWVILVSGGVSAEICVTIKRCHQFAGRTLKVSIDAE